MSAHYDFYHPQGDEYHSTSDSDTETDATYSEEEVEEAMGEWVWNGRTWHWVWHGQNYMRGAPACASEPDRKNAGATPNAYVLIALDWDDTLFPTSHLSRLVDLGRLGSASIRQTLGGRLLRDLAVLDARVVALLRQCAGYGRVRIVTDAHKGWVQHSAYHILPCTWRFMRSHGVEIISSREKYQHRYVDSWARKQRVFQEEVEGALNGWRPRPDTFAFVSVGDDESERAAALAMAGRVPRDCLKVVKLVDWPSLEKMIGQVGCMKSCMYSIVASECHIDANGDDFGGRGAGRRRHE